MQHSVSDLNRFAGGCFLLTMLIMLAACSGNGSTSPSNGEPMQSRSPLAAPPASMMTPHGY